MPMMMERNPPRQRLLLTTLYDILPGQNYWDRRFLLVLWPFTFGFLRVYTIIQPS
jgi:hypothetical protein